MATAWQDPTTTAWCTIRPDICLNVYKEWGGRCIITCILPYRKGTATT